MTTVLFIPSGAATTPPTALCRGYPPGTASSTASRPAITWQTAPLATARPSRSSATQKTVGAREIATSRAIRRLWASLLADSDWSAESEGRPRTLRRKYPPAAVRLLRPCRLPMRLVLDRRQLRAQEPQALQQPAEVNSRALPVLSTIHTATLTRMLDPMGASRSRRAALQHVPQDARVGQPAKHSCSHRIGTIAVVAHVTTSQLLAVPWR